MPPDFVHLVNNVPLYELKTKRFTPEGREDRIARALEILSLPGPSFKVDKETWIWAAQEAEIEYS